MSHVISHLCKGYVSILMNTYTNKLFVAYLTHQLNFSSGILSFPGIHAQGCSHLASFRNCPTTPGSRDSRSQRDLPFPVKSIH